MSEYRGDGINVYVRGDVYRREIDLIREMNDSEGLADGHSYLPVHKDCGLHLCFDVKQMERDGHWIDAIQGKLAHPGEVME